MKAYTFKPFKNVEIIYTHNTLGGIDVIDVNEVKFNTVCPEEICYLGSKLYNEYSDETGLKMACLEHFNESNNGK